MEKLKYQGKFIKVTEQIIYEQIWERAYLNDGLMVLPITDEGKILLIEERRPHEVNPIRLKFVTGLLEDNEDPALCANREMQEEIGYRSNNLELVFSRSSSGTINNTFYFFLATQLTPSKIPNPDGEQTIVSIKEYDVDEVFKMFYSGELPWSLGALGLFKLRSEKRL